MHAPRIQTKPIFHSSALNSPSVPFTNGSPGLIWHCRGPPNHYYDTGGVARNKCRSTLCMHRVCKAEFSLLGPKCSVGAAEPRQNTRNPHGALQGPFDTTEDRQTMTTTLETSLVLTTGSHHARTTYTKPSFYSLALNTPSVRPNQGKTHAIHTWLSRAHLVLLGAAKPRLRYRRRRKR